MEGNAYVMLSEIKAVEEDDFKMEESRSVYVVVYRHGKAIKARLERICEAFGRNFFEIPEDMEQKKAELKKSIEEADGLITVTRSEIKRVLKESCKLVEGFPISRLEFQKWYIAKEKLLYKNMNMLQLEGSLLQGICWCPADEVPVLHETFAEIQKGRNNVVVKFAKIQNHKLTPPTYLKVNDFTWAFQEIVSTYGIPRYREVNPAFFTIITFPFLFGVMFGDICHGLILLGFGVYMCYYRKELVRNKSMICPLLKARYIFVLMGIFAMFCGMIYNDFAGLNFNFFNTCYTATRPLTSEAYKVTRTPNCVYPVGIDPFWKYSRKHLQYENSLKMKLSVILGVVHMFVGLVLKLVNAVEFKKWYDVVFEFVPQLVFLLGLFGFMDLLIFAKWLTDYDNETHKAPYIITAIINMFLKFGDTGSDRPFIAGQKAISGVLLVAVFICVPVMLLPKPFLLRADRQKQLRGSAAGAKMYFAFVTW